MPTLKEKVFSRITNDFQVMTIEAFTQLDLLSKMMDNNHDEMLYNSISNNELIIDSLEVKIRTEVINTIVIVTHNMGQAARISDYSMFMYLGQLVEYDETQVMFTNPADSRTEEYLSGQFG